MEFNENELSPPPRKCFRAVAAIGMTLGVLTALPALAAKLDETPLPPKPNVVMLICDQLTASVLSCYGGPVQTPNIDRIAREGVRFNQATCTTPFCSPSRASLVTGMYPHTHGIVVNCSDYSDGKPGKQEGLTGRDITLEKLVNELGYATHHYGKWHLFGERLPYYPDMYSSHPNYDGELEDVFAKVKAGDPANRMQWYTWSLPVEIAPEFKAAVANLGDCWKDARLEEFVVKMGRLKIPLEQVMEVRTADHTVNQIRSATSNQKPFMVTCSFNGPHDPNATPSPYYEKFDPAKIVLPANRDVREARFEKHWSRRIVADLGEPGLREFLRIYYGMVMLIDDQVGRILKTLEETGTLDNTLIIFTTDHGDMAGGHGMVWKSNDSFYDEIARVPLLMRYPRLFKPQQNELAVDFTDVMPTVLDILGQPIPKQVQGQSLVPFLTGRKSAKQARQYSFCERIPATAKNDRHVLPGTPASFMVRGHGWKYIRYGGNKPEEFLYHLADDPGEMHNLIADKKYASQREKLSKELDAWLERTGWPKGQESADAGAGQSMALKTFARLKPIDAHAHVYKEDAAINDFLKGLNLNILNICVIDGRDPDFKELEPQRSQVLSVFRITSGRAAFCTTFSPYDFEDPGFSQRVIQQLDQDFSAGAIAVKIYKTIGMEITNKAGNFLMADDPVFDAIYRHIAARHKTVVAHLAEPSSCWEPPNPASFDYGYYQKYTNEYAYLHPEYPSKAAILAARDRMMANHPQLLVVGAHLGSMETNVNDIALRLDRHPNFVVDTAGRVPYLMLQPRDKVRAFLIKYQDRILYGTDFVFMPTDDTRKALQKWTDTFERDWKYFSSSQTIESKGHKVQGLHLPKTVLRKFYRDNAVRWFPGIIGPPKHSR